MLSRCCRTVHRRAAHPAPPLPGVGPNRQAHINTRNIKRSMNIELSIDLGRCRPRCASIRYSIPPCRATPGPARTPTHIHKECNPSPHAQRPSIPPARPTAKIGGTLAGRAACPIRRNDPTAPLIVIVPIQHHLQWSMAWVVREIGWRANCMQICASCRRRALTYR